MYISDKDHELWYGDSKLASEMKEGEPVCFWIKFIQVIDNFHIILNSKYLSIVLKLFKFLKVCLFWIQFICNLYYNAYMFDETSAFFMDFSHVHGLFT